VKIAEFMAGKFNPTLSWDGVAILGSCVICCMWFGTLKETVRQQGESLKHHDQVIESLSEGQKLISQNIAVLQTLVNERTKKQ
jgi:hypothetical protein